MFGKTKFTETTKEKLLEFWEEVAKRTNLEINYNENVLNIEREEGDFKVTRENGK